MISNEIIIRGEIEQTRQLDRTSSAKVIIQDKGKAEVKDRKKKRTRGPAVSPLIRLRCYRYRLKIVRTLENCCMKMKQRALPGVVYRELVYQATDFCRYKNAPEIKIVNLFNLFHILKVTST
jgi:hypothetical protein